MQNPNWYVCKIPVYHGNPMRVTAIKYRILTGDTPVTTHTRSELIPSKWKVFT